MNRKFIKALFLFFLLLGLFCKPSENAFAAQTSGAAIYSPLPGQAVQGLVQIIGSVGLEGFQSYQLSFAFEEDNTRTWFLINQSDTPVSQGILGEWDTTVLTDSIYDLRLKVTQQNGNVTELIVESIRVRNYTAVETATPAPTTQISAQSLTQTAAASVPRPQPTLPPYPTIIDENPASVDSANVTKFLKGGAIFGAILIAVVMIILRPKDGSSH